jgi:hypothetical protein
MKQRFVDWNPSRNSLLLLGAIEFILEDYEAQGYKLTLRQLYYQMVTRNAIANDPKSYSSLGDLVSRARLAGLIDWDMIEDRSRVLRRQTCWGSPEEIVSAAAETYHVDHWRGQRQLVEVWCEKDAVSNILAPVCRELDVAFIANRGYTSQSAMYAAYLRFQAAAVDGRDQWIIYFGDHDPSGMDMARDIEARMMIFNPEGFCGVERVALNMDQVEHYQPPENPAKVSDSRSAGYIAEYGESSWELDALEPSVLSELVMQAVAAHVQPTVMRAVKNFEKKERLRILEVGKALTKEERE